MGRIQSPPPSQQGTTDDGISLFTQGSEDEMMDTPPAYSSAYSESSSSATVAATDEAYQPLLSNIAESQPHQNATPHKADHTRPFRQYEELEMLMDPQFDNDPLYAEYMVNGFCEIPAQQLIRIRGTHTDSNRDPMNKEVVDFDIEIPLQSYLLDSTQRNPWAETSIVENGEKAYRGGIFRSRGPVSRRRCRRSDPENQSQQYPKLSMTAWMHLYCASHAPLKSFRISRAVSGLDTKYLHNSIQSLVRSTNYRGHTRVTFPISNRATEIHSHNRINIWRFNWWICTIFYMTFLWIFTWPYLFFSTRKWAVVKVDWPFSVTDEYGVKTYAQCSEEVWMSRWKACIEKAVVSKSHGTLTVEDLVRSETPLPPFRSGSVAVDRVVGFVGAAGRGMSEIRRSWGWAGDC